MRPIVVTIPIVTMVHETAAEKINCGTYTMTHSVTIPTSVHVGGRFGKHVPIQLDSLSLGASDSERR